MRLVAKGNNPFKGDKTIPATEKNIVFDVYEYNKQCTY
jgi:hypothetical protein